MVHTSLEKLRALAADIKLSHTVFAMPWAVHSTFLAAGGWPKWTVLGLIVACMVMARTVAMTANRLLDAALDAKNPRTAGRAIPAGRLSRSFMFSVLLGCSTGFILATAGFGWVDGNRWPLLLSVPVLLFVCGYPLLKRFTQLCHYYLGAALALAPVCAWVAVKGRLDLPPVLMGLAVLLWTAGFDIVYACQDYTSDRETGVFSVPAKIGIGPALWTARFTHLLSWTALLMLWKTTSAFSWLFLVAVAIAGLLLVIEHSLVRKNDLSKLGLAFFTVNGVISVIIGLLGIADVFW